MSEVPEKAPSTESKGSRWAILAGALLICVFVVYETFQDVIVIEPFSVPKILADGGLTGEVAAHRLQDEIDKIKGKAGTSMELKDISNKADLPDFDVPKLGMHLQAAITYFGELPWIKVISESFNIKKRQILSGELTLIDSNTLHLKLRLAQKEVSIPNAGRALKDVDGLLAAGARAVMMATQPYILAAADFDPERENNEEAKKVVNHIVLTFKPKDPQYTYALSLRGAILRSECLIDDPSECTNIKPISRCGQDAIKEYERAIDNDKSFALAYSNIGQVYNDACDLKNAISNYREAIKLNNKLYAAHYNLGEALENRRFINEAMAEYQNAIVLDGATAAPHVGIGNILKCSDSAGNIPNCKADLENAKIQYQTAIDKEPDNVEAYKGLADVYQKINNGEKALCEYSMAASLEKKMMEDEKDVQIEKKLIAEYKKVLAASIKVGGVGAAGKKCPKDALKGN